MNTPSNLINRLSPSATLAMSQRSAELKAQGVDVINLSVGEPDFNTPDHIKEAAKQAIDDNFSRYSPVPGYPALRQAIVDKLKNENNLEYTINQISCSNGAKQSVCNVVMALVNEGDEVIVPAPYWVSYPEMVLMVSPSERSSVTSSNSTTSSGMGAGFKSMIAPDNAFFKSSNTMLHLPILRSHPHRPSAFH